MVRLRADSTDRMRGFDLSGRVTGSDIAFIKDDVDSTIARHGCATELAVFEDFFGWDSSALMVLFEVRPNIPPELRRIAIVGAPEVAMPAAVVMDVDPVRDVLFFSVDNLDKAKSWLQEV